MVGSTANTVSLVPLCQPPKKAPTAAVRARVLLVFDCCEDKLRDYLKRHPVYRYFTTASDDWV